MTSPLAEKDAILAVIEAHLSTGLGCRCGGWRLDTSQRPVDPRAQHRAHVADVLARREESGPGWFWTRDEWAEWSNEIALRLPEQYDGDEAQESIILRAVEDMATQLRDALDVLREYAEAGQLPAPCTNERALYERLSNALGHEDDRLTSPGSEAGR